METTMADIIDWLAGSGTYMPRWHCVPDEWGWALQLVALLITTGYAIISIGWLRAYYAEYGGELKVTYATAQQCISCYGAGNTPEMGEDGRMVRMKCYLCQNTKWVRSFKAY